MYSKNRLSQGCALQLDVSRLSIPVELQENVDENGNKEVETAMMNDDVYKPIMHVQTEDDEQVESAFHSEWRMAKVVEVYPDKSETVRNMQVLVKPSQDGSSKYKPSNGYELKRHASKLLMLVPEPRPRKLLWGFGLR